MVSIQRLPVTLTPSSSPSKAKPSQSPVTLDVTPQPVAVSARTPMMAADPAQFEAAHARVQYDQPVGKHREALASYMGVMHQQQRDDFSALVGVDLYV
ncbi:hypothetical protein L4C36_08300 [Photobacterium japonica]|uniref:hypothetical protein n=1 Tax=Photobacterium japonica TaxID=2910235 RepID=UPI003D0D6C29